MKYNGITFRENRNLVILPTMDKENYIEFGYICEEDTPGSILVNYITSEGEKIYALPIYNHGHSLTNLMYGTRENLDNPTHMYLFLKGICYQAPIKTVKDKIKKSYIKSFKKRMKLN